MVDKQLPKHLHSSEEYFHVAQPSLHAHTCSSSSADGIRSEDMLQQQRDLEDSAGSSPVGTRLWSSSAGCMEGEEEAHKHASGLSLIAGIRSSSARSMVGEERSKFQQEEGVDAASGASRRAGDWSSQPGAMVGEEVGGAAASGASMRAAKWAETVIGEEQEKLEQHQVIDAASGAFLQAQNLSSAQASMVGDQLLIHQQERELRSEIWSRVPPELLERIIARLPVTSVLRFRAVCRRWNQLPFCKHFPKLHPHQVGACPPFLSPQSDILYIEGSGKWRTIPFHFLPSKHVVLEASGGGLLLFSKSNRSSRLVEAFYVCNPVTKEWRELEGFSVRTICVACIDVDQSTLDFNVVVTGWAERSDRYMGRSPMIEMFDGRANKWVRKAGVWDDDLLRGLVLVRGTLYLAVNSRNFANLKVVAFDVKEELREVVGGFGDWSKFHCFGHYAGNLTVVVQRRGARVIEIRQLKKQGNADQWVVLDRLSEEKLNAFSTAAVSGGFIFFNYYDEPIALYDLRDQSWRWVDFPPGRKYWLGMRPLAFQPSFVPLKLIQ